MLLRSAGQMGMRGTQDVCCALLAQALVGAARQGMVQQQAAALAAGAALELWGAGDAAAALGGLELCLALGFQGWHSPAPAPAPIERLVAKLLHCLWMSRAELATDKIACVLCG